MRHHEPSTVVSIQLGLVPAPYCLAALDIGNHVRLELCRHNNTMQRMKPLSYPHNQLRQPRRDRSCAMRTTATIKFRPRRPKNNRNLSSPTRCTRQSSHIPPVCLTHTGHCSSASDPHSRQVCLLSNQTGSSTSSRTSDLSRE